MPVSRRVLDRGLALVLSGSLLAATGCTNDRSAATPPGTRATAPTSVATSVETSTSTTSTTEPPGPPTVAVSAADTVFAHGDAGFYGSPGSTPLNRPVVGMAPTAAGHGYWLATADGVDLPYGDAAALPAAPALQQPVVGVAASPSGRGYWLAARDGGVFNFGDAGFFGSAASATSQPVVGMASSPSGRGYWLAAADGGVVPFGDAGFFGSAAGVSSQPVVAMVTTPSGRGYWLVARDGGVFNYGDAAFFGSATAVRGTRPVVTAARTRTGRGYWMATDDGGVFSFGDAAFYGAHGPEGATGRVAAMVATPSGQGYWLATAGTLAGPADLVPVVAPVAADEGRWSPAGRAVGDRTVAWTTTLRPNARVPAASITMFDQSRLRTVVYAGYDQPSGQWSASTVIDPSLRPGLVGAFNGGFRLDASRGGFYSDGRAAIGLRDGAASLVVRADGTATVGMWARDVSLTADVVQVRQNLDLLVDGGQPVANAGNNGAWGATLGGLTFTWRSGLGVDDKGRLIYVAGPGLDALSLAQTLVAAGVVTGMELDINPQWPLLVTYDGGPDPGAVNGTKLRGDMNYPAGHYFAANERDFVAVFAR
jgi:hypothetical protein